MFSLPLYVTLPLLPKDEYRLVWADEFNTPGRPDPNNWVFEQGFVRNQEAQWYQPENAWVENGNLIIEGRRERVKNPNYQPGSNDWRRNREYAEYTAACVKTWKKQQWKYGRFEIRAKIQARPGLWPAIWTLGWTQPWPGCGEIDILEYYDHSILANTAYGTGGGKWDTAKIPYNEIAKEPDWDTKFHTWRMDWDKDFIRLYLDDKLLNETDISKTTNPDGFNPFRQHHYILLNLAIGGQNGGDPSKTDFPSRYEIDYVRVYQK